jgi:UDP-N-acetylmuramate--alanine ligase
MKKLTNLKEMHIFFVGIGGISMSGLAKVSILLGAKVSGSDSQNAYIPELSNLGCEVYLGHNASHITEDIQVNLNKMVIMF